MFTKLISPIRKFHRDEEGLEALQVVMIIAIAAMVMIACATLGKAAVTWMQGKWDELQGTDINGGEGDTGLPPADRSTAKIYDPQPGGPVFRGHLAFFAFPDSLHTLFSPCL